MRRGFSLIEVLVVVSIVGLLAGMGTFQYKNAMDNANNAQMEANVKVVALALETYASEHKGRYPDLKGVPAGTTSTTRGLMDDEFIGRRYLPDNKLPRSPWTKFIQKTNVPVYWLRSADNWDQLCQASQARTNPWGPGIGRSDPPDTHDSLGVIRYSVEDDNDPTVYRLYGNGLKRLPTGPSRIILSPLSNNMR